MSKRVNISYSIDIDDLAPEVFRIVELAKQKIKNVYDNSKLLEEKYVLSRSMVQEITDIRESLAKIDFNLNDASLLINGFLDYESADNTPQAEQLREKVDTFKKTFLDEDAAEEL
jgi:virulence-associated protein VapD